MKIKNIILKNKTVVLRKVSHHKSAQSTHSIAQKNHITKRFKASQKLTSFVKISSVYVADIQVLTISSFKLSMWTTLLLTEPILRSRQWSVTRKDSWRIRILSTVTSVSILQRWCIMQLKACFNHSVLMRKSILFFQLEVDPQGQ